MLENTLTLDETAADGTERIVAARMNAAVAPATEDRGETQAADGRAESGPRRPLRRWSVADLIASARFANDR